VLATCDFLTEVHARGECNRQTAFEPLMGAAITKAIYRLLVEGLPRSENPLAASPELIAATVSPAICGAVNHWFSLSGRPPARVAAPQLAQLILPMLGAESPVEVVAAESSLIPAK